MSVDRIARTLERDRLAQRVRRIESVTRELRQRGVYRHARTGATPAPLREAISSFERELARLRSRLIDLGRLEAMPPRGGASGTHPARRGLE